MIKPAVSFADFMKLDLRVGKVVRATAIEKSNKLIRMEVDLGNDYGVRVIIGGLLGIYKKEDLVGKKFVFVANLEPKKMVGQESQGMVLCADFEGKPILIAVPDNISQGSIIR